MTNYEGRPFAVLGVNIGSQNEAKDALEDKKLGTRSWRDAQCVGGYATERYGVRYELPESDICYDFPREYLIDAKGVIRSWYTGHNFPDPRDLQSDIDRLLAETGNQPMEEAPTAPAVPSGGP